MWGSSRENIIALVLPLVFFTTSQVSAEANNILPNGTYLEIEKNGQTLYMPEELLKKIEHEKDVWHWMPWVRTRTVVEDNLVKEVDICVFQSSLDSFPDSIFTEQQLKHGAFLCYVLFGIYAFTLLAVVCNDYFIPCVELICEDLKIPQNVAAATFMSVATSCPEFFVNTISTFLIDSDMGIGTIVGSAIFNALGVGAIGGLAAITPIAIDKRPVTRDILIYMINVSVLVSIVWDSQVDWYEALVLGLLYILYFVVMFNSMKIFAIYDKLIGNRLNRNQLQITEVVVNDHQKSMDGVDNKGFDDVETVTRKSSALEKISLSSEKVKQDAKQTIRDFFTFPKEESTLNKLWWLYSFPLKLILGVTIPSTVLFRRFYPVAFIMCIVWIGVNSYFVTWSMSVIGDTFSIPESVMGMTFLAFGGCLPEACSIYIMSRRGEGGIGVSNALGANSLAILFALGVPWLIRTLTLVAQGADQTYVRINSAGMDFVIASLLVAVTLLYAVLYFSKFYLRKTVGFILMFLYVIFITFAVLVETDVILRPTILNC